MACLKSLKTDFLSGADAGGTWTYEGTPAITVTITGSGSTVLNNGDTIPGGDDPELDFETLSGLACGVTHIGVFQYSGGVPGCDDSVLLNLIIECPPDAGGNNTVNLCEGDAPRTIFTDLAGTPDNTGVWSGDTANPGYSAGTGVPTDDTFDPGLSGIGTFNFIYTVSSTSADCPCAPAVATVTYVVSASFEAGTGSNVEICI